MGRLSIATNAGFAYGVLDCATAQLPCHINPSHQRFQPPGNMRFHCGKSL